MPISTKLKTMKIVRAFTSKLKGQLSVRADDGTEFILKIPVEERQAVAD